MPFFGSSWSEEGCPHYCEECLKNRPLATDIIEKDLIDLLNNLKDDIYNAYSNALNKDTLLMKTRDEYRTELKSIFNKYGVTWSGFLIDDDIEDELFDSILNLFLKTEE